MSASFKIGNLVLLGFGGKQKRENACFQEQISFKQIFTHFIVCMWTAWCTRLKTTQNVATSDDKEILWISQISHFPKTDYRF